MIEKEKISVIVAAYNIAPYLERCVESLVNQTYKNLEIILVNDGSTDETGAVCDKLAELDKRIKVIHKKNGGPSEARNVAIDVAQGDYLSFIDGDDFIELDSYECMIAEMIDPSVSMVACGFIGVDLQGNISTLVSPTRQYLSKEEALMNLLGGENYISQSSGNKLYRIGLFENVRYKNGILNEDMELLPRLLDVSDHVVLLDKIIYHYIKRPGSITTSDYSMARYNTIQIERDIYLMCKEKYPKLQPYASFYELKCLNGMLHNLSNSRNYKEFKLQELNIRRKIIGVFFRCNRWKEIREAYGARMKIYCITAIVGVRNVDKLVEIKEKIKQE